MRTKKNVAQWLSNCVLNAHQQLVVGSAMNSLGTHAHDDAAKTREKRKEDGRANRGINHNNDNDDGKEEPFTLLFA